MPAHDPQILIALFNGLFQHSYRTRLVRGGAEPLYLPTAIPQGYHQLMFARGYFSSALHEISHWCLAGSARRQLVDFGYWYVPDGRTAEEQRRFEQVEATPQALECLFAEAAGLTFRPSRDNLTGNAAADKGFRQHILERKRMLLEMGLPPRAELFLQALLRRFRNF